MSTAGKVLVVIIAVFIVVWLVLMAKLDNYNREGGAALKQQTDETARLEEEIAQKRVKLINDKAAVDQAQIQMDKDLADLRLKISTLEKAESDTNEIRTRLQSQQANVEQGAKSAETEKSTREKEKADLQAQVAKAKSDINTLTDENKTLTDQMNELRDKFTTTVAENRQLVRQIQERGRSAIKPAVGR